MKHLLNWVVVLLFVQQSFSQTQPQTNQYADAFRLIDSWIEAQRDYLNLPSISVAIVKDQETIWSKAYGMANSDNKRCGFNEYALQHLLYLQTLYIDCHHAIV